MNQFVQECRREWKRLRVPDPVADEMAAELAADLEEAEAEGVSPVEVLGRGAADPRSFAASWAAERAVIPPRGVTARLRRRSLIPVALAALTIVAAVGAGLVVFASPDGSAPVTTIAVPPPPSFATKASVPAQVWVAAKEDSRLLVRFPRPGGGGVDINMVGSILLIVGIAGAILSLPFLFWSSSRRFDTASL